MHITATYSPEDNKLRLYASSRLDPELYQRVKAAGFKWAPKQELFVAPMWTPARAALCEELAGEIGDEDTTLVARAEERADRFEDYSDNRRQDAEAAKRAVDAIAENIPLGQPILVGHHSEKHARRDAAKIENGMRRAVKMWDTANYWQQRAAGAIHAAKYKERPDVRARRIKGLESDIRVYRAKFTPDLKQPAILQHRWNDPADAPRIPHVWCGLARGGHWVAQEDLPAIERNYSRWIEHCEMRLLYERAMQADSGGTVADRTAPQKGGAVRCWASPRGGWSYIQKVNKISVTLLDNWNNGGRDFNRVIPFDKLNAVMSAAEVEAARADGRLINDTPRGFSLLDAEPEPVAVIEPAAPEPEIYSPGTPDPGATLSPMEMAETLASVFAYQTQQQPEPESQSQAQGFEAMRESLRAGVQIVTAPQLFPTPPELAARMVSEADIQPGNRILEPSAGTGRILYALARAGELRDRPVTAVELNYSMADALRSSFPDMETVQADFLDVHGRQFDRILMNPPFANGDDIRHIRHAFEMLAPGGLLVAICANGPRQNDQLRPFVEENGGTWEELPADTFKESGTSVRTVLLTIPAEQPEPEMQQDSDDYDDAPQPPEPEPTFTLAPTPAIPAQQLALFGHGD